MIATCTSCQAKYRVPDEKIGPRGARIRCHKCQAFFRVPPPAGEGTPGPGGVASPFTPLPGFFEQPRGPAGAEPDPFAAPPPAPADDPFAPGPAAPPSDDPFAAAASRPPPDDPFLAASAAGHQAAGLDQPARANGAAREADPFDGPAPVTSPGVLDPFAAPEGGPPQDLFGPPSAPAADDPFALPARSRPAMDPFDPSAGGPADPGLLPGRHADPAEVRGGVGPGLGLRLPLTDLSDLVGPPGQAGREVPPPAPLAHDVDLRPPPLPAFDVPPQPATGLEAPPESLDGFDGLPPGAPGDAEPVPPAGPELTLEEMTPTGGGREIPAIPAALADQPDLDLALPELDRSALVSPPPASPPPLPDPAEPSGLELAEQTPGRMRRPEPPAPPPPVPPPRPAAAPRSEPRVEAPPVPSGSPRSRLQVVAMNSLSLAALLVVTFGLLAIWRGDGDLLAPRSGRAPAGAVAAETSSGLYDTEAGPRVLFVRGVVRSQSPAPLGPVTVRAEILRGGQVVAVGQALAGAVPTAEEMASLGSPGAAERLRTALGARAPGRLEPGASLPFLVTFTEVPPDLVDLEVRVVAVAEPAGQRG